MRANIGIKRHETNAIALSHDDVRQARGQLECLLQLCLAAFAGVSHTPAGIHQQHRTQVGFLLVLTYEVAVGLGKHLPVYPAYLIALHIFTMLGEFHTKPLVWRAVHAGDGSFNSLLRHQLKVGDALQLFRLQHVG